ncbi:hypothetical protein JCM11251_005391 [Rhodosporidiobolus azoricus]
MTRMSAEDAFMADLFKDLDDNAFNSSPPSSHPRALPTPRAGLSKPPGSAQRKATATQAPQRLQHSFPRPPLSAARSAPSSRSQTPFWDDPFSHPALSQNSLSARTKREREAGIVPSSCGQQAQGRAKKAVVGGVLSPRPNRGVKREKFEGATTCKRALKHVAVELEKENEDVPWARKRREEPMKAVKVEMKVEPPALNTVQVKVEEADEFGDVTIEDVDWASALAGFDDEAAAIEQDKGPPRNKQFTRCQVEEVVDNIGSSSKRQKILTVSGSSFEGLTQVVLCDDWVDTPVETGAPAASFLSQSRRLIPYSVGDIVNLIGAFNACDPSKPALTLTRSDGLLVLHPDILASSTKVADSSNCTRKAVLQELIRTIGGLTPSLTYGNMLHALMQECMAERRWDQEWRNGKIEDILKQNGAALWSIEVGFEKARNELRERSKEFEAFAERFIGDKPKPDALLSDPRAADTARSRLAINSTFSIEEDVWSPRFGLKGKIDASTSTTVVDSIGFTRKGTTPFEIKTGRANAGMEHRAQTMLYTLLMSDRYDEEIDSGILYYTQTNDVFRVQAARNEIRGLIIARNNFVTYLHRRMTLSVRDSPSSSQRTLGQAPRSSPACAAEVKREENDEMDEEDALWAELGGGTQTASQAEEVALLPPPIDDDRGCSKCYVRDACMLFRRAVDGAEAISANEDDPLQLIYTDQTDHLTETHVEFFKHWERLISCEEQELVRFKREIWTMTAEEREMAGRCFGNMRIVDIKTEDDHELPLAHRFTYRLTPHPPPSLLETRPSLLGGSISVNDPVVISLENPSVLALSRGFVLSLSSQEVVVGLDQSLTDFPLAKRSKATDLVFRVDKDELQAGLGRIRDNLIHLFVANGDERRRRLIVDLEPPNFDAKLANEKDRLIPPHLNSDQKDALEKVLAAQDYALILGMPGTGKTTTIAELLKTLARAGKSILLTSYTHSAVDNILLKVKDAGMSILRCGNRDKVMPALHKYTLTNEDYATSFVDIDNKLMMPQIVATTCLGINEPVFTKRRFDVCIVDEASQVTLPTCLGPLRFADKFILVGDHNQLPPLVRNHTARKGGLDVSLFKRLSDAHPAAVVNLAHQYRMSEEIMLLSNELIYDGKLQAGTEEVAMQRLQLPFEEKRVDLQEWQRQVVDPSRAVLFVDTDALPAHELRSGSYIENELEALLVKQTVSALTTCGVPETSVGVITPYRQQIKLLQRKLKDFVNVEILTADRSQGRDKEVILVSLVRSNQACITGDLLKDWRRLNVFLTRAKSKLVIFGSRSTLRHVPLLQQFLDLVDEKGWVLELPKEVGEALRVKEEMKEEMKEEEVEEQEKKPLRRGGGALTLKEPFAKDVINGL